MAVPLIVVLEGADETGKSTILKKLGEITKNKYVIIHRAHLSNFVYAKKRGEDAKSFFEGFVRLCSIYPVSLILVISNRLQGEYDADQKAFIEACERWNFDLKDSCLVIAFNNSGPLEELNAKVLELKEMLEKYENSRYFPSEPLWVS